MGSLPHQKDLEHVLFIPDGNGRWASQRGWAREQGHMAGIRHITELLDECLDQQIRYASIYAFSTENWNRPQQEIQGIFAAIAELITQNIEDWYRLGVRFRHIGQIHRLEPYLQQIIANASELTQQNSAIIITMIIDYGARNDLVRAMQSIQQELIPYEEITEQLIASRLSTAAMPDPDLVIRTGGRYRISNLCLWEICYSELWFTDVLWPDFQRQHLCEALKDFHMRTRTFGSAPAESLVTIK